jgi:hypothetical protein
MSKLTFCFAVVVTELAAVPGKLLELLKPRMG